jgi:hypothetical protein
VANFSLASLIVANSSQQAHDMLKLPGWGCSGEDDNGSKGNRCSPYTGLDQGTKERKLLALKLPSSSSISSVDRGGGGGGGSYDGRRKRRKEIGLSVAKGQGALPAPDAVKKLVTLEAMMTTALDGDSGGDGRVQQQQQQKKKTTKADIVVLTGGLHYLHLWPAVKFETERLDIGEWAIDGKN